MPGTMHRRKSFNGSHTSGTFDNPASPTYNAYYGTSKSSSSSSHGYYGSGSSSSMNGVGMSKPQGGGSVGVGSKMSYTSSSGSSSTLLKRKEKRYDNTTSNSIMSNKNKPMLYFIAFLCVLSWLFGFLYIVYCKTSYKSLEKQYDQMKRDLDATRRTSTHDVRNIQTQLERKERELVKLRDDHSRRSGSDLEKHQKIEQALRTHLEIMKNKIARESRREVEEKFGYGPYRVRVHVEAGRLKSFFVIQLYSVVDMPHAVHLFLEQVVHGLWDGCSFVINAGHILQAGPHPYESPVGMDDHRKLDLFQDIYLDTLAYQEYNVKFPHKKFTVGFAGRPSGPDFYINKVDNSIAHGPGGQTHHALAEEADPCFGEIVDGFPTLEKLFVLPVDGAYDLLQKPIRILQMELEGYQKPQQPPSKNKKPNPQQQQQHVQDQMKKESKQTTTTTTQKGDEPMVDGRHRPNLHEIHHDMVHNVDPRQKHPHDERQRQQERQHQQRQQQRQRPNSPQYHQM